MKRALASCVTLVVLLTPVCGAGTIYVDDDAPLGGDGQSWDTAFKHLQDALGAALAGDETWVAQGTYRPDRDADHPDGTGDREATFELITGVALYGGYAGIGAPDPNERNIELYETTLSGDLLGDDEPNFVNYDENSRHVVTGSGTDDTVLLSGFTVTSGFAHVERGSRSDYEGAGVYNKAGSPTLANCTFSGNSAHYYGGGMYNDGGSPTLTNCTFSGNSAHYYGGGMSSLGDDMTITACTFSGNSANIWGGGIYCTSSNTTIINCAIGGKGLR